jgi:hypothetical protein
VHDPRSALARGRVELRDRVAHEQHLAGQVGVVGPVRGAGVDELQPVLAVRPDGRHDDLGPLRHLVQRRRIA